LGVNNDASKKTAQEAVEKNELNWRSWWDGDDGPIVKEFEIQAFPTIFLIDHRGVIRARDIPFGRVHEAIAFLIAEAEAEFAAGAPRYPLRRFVDNTGKFNVMARLIRVDGDTAVLQNEAGKEISVPVKRLSKDDQRYIKSQAQPLE
jgi:hypothetical protein